MHIDTIDTNATGQLPLVWSVLISMSYGIPHAYKTRAGVDSAYLLPRHP